MMALNGDVTQWCRYSLMTKLVDCSNPLKKLRHFSVASTDEIVNHSNVNRKYSMVDRFDVVGKRSSNCVTVHWWSLQLDTIVIVVYLCQHLGCDECCWRTIAVSVQQLNAFVSIRNWPTTHDRGPPTMLTKSVRIVSARCQHRELDYSIFGKVC